MLRFGSAVLALCATTVWLMSAGISRAEPPVEPNLELMGRLTGEAVEELIGQMPAGRREMTLSSSSNDERYDFIANVFTRILTSRGYTTFVPRSAGVPRGVVLEFQALDFNLRYSKIYRPFVIGGKRVKREANVKLLATLSDPADDSVVWMGEATKSHADQFSFSEVDRVETGLFEFNKPVHAEASWGKFVEPVVVSGIVVGLIYLFFSNQSD